MPKTRDLKPMAVWQEIEPTADDWDTIGKDEIFRMLVHLHLVRVFEEALLDAMGDDLINGPVHSSIGEEGSAIGAMAVLRDSDQMSGSHRGHSQFLGKVLRFVDKPGWNPLREPAPAAIRDVLQKTFAEIMGLAQGYCKGRGGSMHLRWAQAGCLGSNAIIGGGVPFAAGEAWAKKRKGKGDAVFCFYGDGSVHIGSVPETLNLAALWDLPICFFIVNNGYAVSTTLNEQTRETRMSSRGLAFGIPSFRVDGMDPIAVRVASEKAVELMRAGKGPVMIEAMVYRYRHHGGPLAGSAFGYRTKEEEAEWRERDPIAFLSRKMIERGWLTADEDAVLRSRAQEALRDVVDALTEMNGNHRQVRPELWPDPSFRDFGLRGDLAEFKDVTFVEQDTFSGVQKDAKFIEVMARVMGRRMETDERIFVIGEDVHKLRGGTNGQTRGLPERFPDRIIPTPISEGGFSGLAGGVALEGTYRPVVELMYPDFALVAADQLFNQIAKVRHMFGGDDRLPIVVRSKVALGAGYGSQHSMDPAGLYSNWPGWRIVAPSTPFDYVGLFNTALRCEDPVLVIEHQQLYQMTGPVPDDLDYFIPPGKAKVARAGKDFTVLTYLYMVPMAMQMAEQMGIDPEIVDLRSLDRAGLDWETIGASIRKTNNVLILEQGSLTASYGGMLGDEVQRRFFDYLDQPVKRVYGGEASPSVSRVLEQATIVKPEDIRRGFASILADKGFTQWAAQ